MLDKKIIPIVLLHHDQADVLLRAVKLIHERTIYPFRIFIIDNNSPDSEDLRNTFQILEAEFQAQIIHNSKNNWIYGFNLALDHPAWPQSQLYAFSDADIYVPLSINGVCWLTHLAQEMNSYCAIGKLGLALDHENLKGNPSLVRSLGIEESYLRGPKIGSNIVAPVDTTMALYRSDYFITKFRFQIGHASLAKPQYFTCRTGDDFKAVHVGWDYYPNNGAQSYSPIKQWNKSLAMVRAGAYVAPELMGEFRPLQRIFLLVIQFGIRSLHAFKVSALMFWYLAMHFPRRINEIQAGVRK
ncbi:glycosyltransferase [Polynucleobacter sp. MG-27-Goln-C1]|uniref:glycosyltransferase n=1 Tax=Polynucleobacter sp. MG-27-Goln-C1 TaxID=1819726 RepID=UPI001C0C4C93|nr:glycosyltransferase [Polynucleobacter sp. MG-27-Goln-C1]MBU3612840.1 hypothetical protein [Polynucleobacter sp. MG-27-Goln-C1]